MDTCLAQALRGVSQGEAISPYWVRRVVRVRGPKFPAANDHDPSVAWTHDRLSQLMLSPSC
ncbi:hypothetical protein M404DRAFT_997998 [Pisolithus tinctorius Marx 270]|uniref:Uncharacterized protein n=1 Tax=Pisolithus tinctorius Marx 270 TaxID=870435 RepID=A0A0C3P497_PISTI|nr:hypothetical protein M404DRAFT_997998 [Pisolithus tinctorius Marx 270]